MSDSGNTVLNGPIYSTFADDPDFGDLLEMFVETIPEKRQSIQEAFATGDLCGVRTQAHQLKGAGGGYGFGGLTGVAAELEDACAASDIEHVRPAFDRLLNYLDRLSV